jgi:hypothetical protein
MLAGVDLSDCHNEDRGQLEDDCTHIDRRADYVCPHGEDIEDGLKEEWQVHVTLPPIIHVPAGASSGDFISQSSTVDKQLRSSGRPDFPGSYFSLAQLFTLVWREGLILGRAWS